LVAGEQSVHLLRRADEELVALKAETLGVAACLAGIDAQEHVVSEAVLLAQVVGIAGRYQRQAKAVGGIDGPPSAKTLDLQTIVLDFDIKVVFEELFEPDGEAFGLFKAITEDVVAELGGGAATEADDPFAVGFEQFLVDARLAVVALEERQRRHLDEV